MMEQQDLELMIYKNMYAYKYMLEDRRYSFNEYTNTVAAITSREIKKEEDDEDDTTEQ